MNTAAELTALVKHFEELFKLSQHKLFGVSSEKLAAELGQLSLFEKPAIHEAREPETKEITYTETLPNSTTTQIDDFLPRSGKLPPKYRLLTK
ncbi:MAG: transposase [Oscillospiraceae bacterium]|nr:transposase [Oscillospiraceae bacterium]